MGKRLAKKVIVLGWDAADWNIIRPLIAAGKMPTLKKFLEEGSWGNIATLDPPMSPMLWTSIATGKRADQHGILGFIEPSPNGKGIQAISSSSRKVKAIWNILNQQGMKSNVVGWWPSHPAEPINGVMVSNFYQKCNTPIEEKWPMMKETVYPERLAEKMAELRVHPAELTMAHILPFIPKAKEIDHEKDKRLFGASKILSQCASIHNAATHLMENEPWDFMAVYFDTIDHFCHLGMKFHPPQRPGVPDDDYEMYKHLVTASYLYHDMMLERTLELVGDDATVMIVSDHGFHSDHLRPKSLPDEPAAPAHEHSPFGMIAIKGPGIKKDHQIFGASIIDVTPTLLALYGLPVAKDMEGTPLVECFSEDPFLEHIESWEKVEGVHGRHDPNKQVDKWANQEALDQLIELGYIDKPNEDLSKAIQEATNESQYYLARNYIDASKYEEAINILESLVQLDNKAYRYSEKLAQCYLNKKLFKECENLIAQIRKNIEEPPLSIDYLEGQLFTQTNKLNIAKKKFEKLLEKAPNNPTLLVEIAKIFHSRQQWDKAEESYKLASQVDPGNSIARHSLGLCKLRLDRPEEALEDFFAVIEQKYYYPQCHFHIAEALVHLGKYTEAAQAFELTLTMAPKMTRARKWLIELYEEKVEDPERSSIHKQVINKTSKGEVVIISGLPRSGTSMMMQMIEKGGIEPLTDKLRKADDNNLKGYYEYDPVKRIAADNSFMHLANGKSLKVIAQLLPALPPDFSYKIIFMVRKMDEVLLSQQVMLGRGKEKAKKSYPSRLAEVYKEQIEKTHIWIDSQPNVDLLQINYTDVIDQPLEQARIIGEFLDHKLDVNKMVKVVDPDLYRSKSETGETKVEN